MRISSYQSFNWVSPIDRQGLLSTTGFDQLAPFSTTPPCQAALLPVSRFRARLVEVKASIGKSWQIRRPMLLFPWEILNEKRLSPNCIRKNMLCFSPLQQNVQQTSPVALSIVWSRLSSHLLPSPPHAFQNSHLFSLYTGQQGCGEEAKAVRGEHWQDATTSQTRWG